MGSRLSVAELARQARCSAATISNVLNNKGRISEERRQEILQLITKLGYPVNVAKRKLREQPTHALGVLFYPTCGDLFGNSFYAEVMKAFQQRLSQAGYRLVLENDPATTGGSLVPECIRARKVDGMVFVGPYPEQVMEAVRQYNFPALLLDGESSPPIDSVVSDGHAGAREAVYHLAARGHRRLAMIAYDHPDRNIDLRIEGFLAGLREHGLPEEGAVIRDAISHDALYASLRRRLDVPNPPTALMVVNDTLAVALMRFLAADGIAVPDRLSVIGYDDDKIAQEGVPALTTIGVDKAGLGRAGAELILQRLAMPDMPIAVQRLPVGLVQRASVARLAAS